MHAYDYRPTHSFRNRFTVEFLILENKNPWIQQKSPGRGGRGSMKTGQTEARELDGQTEPTNYCLRGSDGHCCFQLSFFLCTQDNL